MDQCYQSNNEILKTHFCVGVCGKYIQDRDSVHVGIFVKDDSIDYVSHFVATNSISLGRISDSNFDCYEFIKLKNFPEPLKYSLVPLLERLSNDGFRHLNISLDSVYYVDGKFQIINGVAHHIVHHGAIEGIINCGIYVLSILNSFPNQRLIDTQSFPPIEENKRLAYLEIWLNHNGVDEKDKHNFRKYNIELRGKHVLAAPLHTNTPVIYNELKKTTDKVINDLQKKYLP